MKIFFHSYSKRLALLASIFLLLPIANASTFSIANDSSIVGKVEHTSADMNDSVVTIAQRYNLGINSVLDANPGFSENIILTNGTLITVPTAFILPNMPKQGIVINLPEMRLYYFLPDGISVMTFPIGIGKIGRTVPVTTTSVMRKVVNPTWYPTPSERVFNHAQGIELPNAMPAGPDNPLGPYAIYMRIPTYLIHSTIFPESIGRRASFGCIRMNEDDIKQFYPLVTPGTRIAIVDMPVKAGWFDNHLYLQAYPPLEENSTFSYNVLEIIDSQLSHNSKTFINWQMIAYLTEHPDGIPHQIGFKAN